MLMRLRQAEKKMWKLCVVSLAQATTYVIRFRSFRFLLSIYPIIQDLAGKRCKWMGFE